MERRLLLRAFAYGTLTLSSVPAMMLAGCSKSDAPAVAGETSASGSAVFRVGVTAGPHADIVTEAVKVAKTKSLNVEVVEFTDYVTPDTALNDKKLDAAVYQHEPFLNTFNRERGTKLVKAADAVVQPMGFYSKKIKSVNAIPDGATIAIPNDPSNGGRGLLLIEAAGLIKLKADRGSEATVADIVENPKNLRIQELEAAQLPRSIDDLDVACVPMNYVISAGLSPEKEGFFFEDRSAPYALIIIAAREDNAASAALKTFVESYQSPEVRAYIEKTFKGQVRPAW